jgi:hypothetical protein
LVFGHWLVDRIAQEMVNFYDFSSWKDNGWQPPQYHQLVLYIKMLFGVTSRTYEHDSLLNFISVIREERSMYSFSHRKFPCTGVGIVIHSKLVPVLPPSIEFKPQRITAFSDEYRACLGHWDDYIHSYIDVRLTNISYSCYIPNFGEEKRLDIYRNLFLCCKKATYLVYSNFCIWDCPDHCLMVALSLNNQWKRHLRNLPSNVWLLIHGRSDEGSNVNDFSHVVKDKVMSYRYTGGNVVETCLKVGGTFYSNTKARVLSELCYYDPE